MKNVTEICYEIDYQPSEQAIKISNLMASCDLGIERISVTEDFILKTTTRVNKEYFKKISKVIKDAIKASGGKVFSIKLKYYKKLK